MSMNNLQGSDFPKKQPVSARKAEANRLNASKSTGPKTERGKANSRRNARKHLLFATYRFPDFLAKDENSDRSEEHTSELQSQSNLVCRLLLEKKKQNK